MVVGGSFLPRFFEGAVFFVVEPLSSMGEFLDFERRTRPVCVSKRLGAFFEVRGEREGSGIGVF